MWECNDVHIHETCSGRTPTHIFGPMILVAAAFKAAPGRASTLIILT